MRLRFYFTLSFDKCISNNNYAFIILEAYIMALIKIADCIYVFDSRARNNNKLHDIYLI